MTAQHPRTEPAAQPPAGPPPGGPGPYAAQPQFAPQPAGAVPARTRWRDVVFGWRSTVAVFVAGIVLGGLGGAAITVLVDHHDNAPTIQRFPGGGFPGGFGQRGDLGQGTPGQVAPGQGGGAQG